MNLFPFFLLFFPLGKNRVQEPLGFKAEIVSEAHWGEIYAQVHFLECE